MDKPKIVIVVAAARNGTIGRDGDMPWRLPSDLKRFKALTLGKPVVMGRKTFESIGKPLTGRPNIVISRNPDYTVPGTISARSLDEALAIAESEAKALGVDEVCVIGGGEIYRQAIGLAGILHVTEVDAEIDGDTRFPAIDPRVFGKIFEEVVPRGEKDSHPMRFTTWQRRNGAE